MTIIAYSTLTKTMSCDSACYQESTHIGSVKKIWRVGGGGLIGAAGNLIGMLAFIRWVTQGCNEDDDSYPAINFVFDAIVVDPGGKISYYEAGISEPIPIKSKYCAIGSARDIALGAMAAGATPTQAVKYSIHHSGDCKPPVRTYKLKGE